MRLIDYIQERQENGKLWFIKSEAMERLGCTLDALQQAIYDLTQKNVWPLLEGNSC